MRTLTVVLVLVLATPAPYALAAPVETPNGPATIIDMRRDMMTWKGRLVAMRGRIVQVEFDVKDQPVLKLEVADEAQTEAVWIASLTTGSFSVGDDILMLGLMTRVPEPDEAPGSKLNSIIDDPFMILGFCYVNLTADWGGGDKARWKLCDEWFKRRMPDTPRE